MSIDPKSGFCAANSIFYSKRTPISLPSDHCLDITTFVSSGKHTGKVALVDAATDRKITYPELWSNVESLATSLSDMGIRKGHVVLLLSPNSIFFPIICLAVMSLGAIITTTNPLNTSGEIAKQIKDSKPILVFTITALLPKITSNLPIVLIDNGGSEQKNATVVSHLEIMLQTKPNQNRARGIITQDDTATLLYSSGTTGLSKGVASSHRNLIATASVIMNRFQYDENSNPNHTFICTVPMFHVYGLAAFACGLLGFGSTIVILSKFELNEMLSSIERYRATYLPLVPPILVAMIHHAKTIKKKYDLHSLKRVLSGGAPLSKEVIEGFTLAYPTVTILQGYGLTETCSIGASTDSMEESRRYGTAGLLSPNMEGKIVDPDSGKSLPVNRKGELWLRGPSVMKGYFSNPEATASTLDSDGWLKTGDLCYFDEDGFIFVVDRLKELIKYKGYQVAPAELEALLISHPEIEDAAVIPFPDKDVGQYPLGYVVRKAGSHLSPGEVMEFIAKQVSPYKRIRRVEFVSSIPKNASGKILRKDLISMATSKL